MKASRRWPLLVLFSLVAMFLTEALLRAEQTGFTASLSPENRAAAGLTRLTAEQIASLDRQVQQEIATARAGHTTAFSTSFTHRRSPQQRKEAGLDQLMTPELTRLDALVAAAVAATPAPVTLASPTIPEKTSDWVETTPYRLNVHGEVGMTMSWSKDGSHGYGGWAVTSVSDPSNRLTLTVGYGQGEFKGKYPYCFPEPFLGP